MVKKKINLIVFDMDGVLIDVSGSYRETIRQTARLFFKGSQFWNNLPDPLFSLADLAEIKQSGGLNNDWELTYLVLELLMTQVDLGNESIDDTPWAIHEHIIGSSDLGRLTGFLSAGDSPLRQLLREKGRPSSAFIKLMSAGDVGSGNIIKQIFQEVYLGRDLFESTYGLPAKVYRNDGLIRREKLLIDQIQLEKLSQNNILAIATGRPGAEAEFPLDHFNLHQYFRSMYSLDDCLEEEKMIMAREAKQVSLSKPHPFMLDAIASAYTQDVAAYYYIGDMPDDMLAASRSEAGYLGIGITKSAPDREKLGRALIEAGADHVIANIEELLDIIH